MRLVSERDIDAVSVKHIIKLQGIREKLRFEIHKHKEDPPIRGRLCRDLMVLNFTLQDLWGFDRDITKHEEVYYP